MANPNNMDDLADGVDDIIIEADHFNDYGVWVDSEEAKRKITTHEGIQKLERDLESDDHYNWFRNHLLTYLTFKYSWEDSQSILKHLFISVFSNELLLCYNFLGPYVVGRPQNVERPGFVKYTNIMRLFVEITIKIKRRNYESFDLNTSIGGIGWRIFNNLHAVADYR